MARAPINFRKNCQINVDVGVPAGWTYGIAAVVYRGYAHLGKGARGTLAASYYYAGGLGAGSTTRSTAPWTMTTSSTTRRPW